MSAPIDPTKQQDDNSNYNEFYILPEGYPIVISLKKLFPIPGVADSLKLFRVVGDDSIHAFPDPPTHQFRVIYSPNENQFIGGTRAV